MGVRWYYRPRGARWGVGLPWWLAIPAWVVLGACMMVVLCWRLIVLVATGILWVIDHHRTP